MNAMSTNLRQKLKELNKQKEQFDNDNQNIDIHKNSSMPPIQFKKTLLYPLVLHPKCFNSDNQTITRTYEEIRRHEQGFNDDMPLDCGQNARWKQIQENTFTRWANERLKLVNRHIKDLQTDLGDGLNLIALIEILTHKKLPRYNHRPQFRSQKLENVSVVLDYIENVEKRRLVNIDASDIVDGKIKLILGLLWTLILHYSITLPAWELPSEKRETIENLKPKQKLMNWLQAKLSKQINIENFTSDWNDGRAIGAVLDSCYPGLFPNWADRDPKNALENAREAMDLAEKWLGIPQLIQPHEMISPQVDEQSMMTYLSQYPNAQLKPGAPIKPKNYAHLIRCYGSGLDRAGHIVEKPVIFHIETCAAGLGEVDVVVVNPKGQIEEYTIEFREDTNRTYDCVFYPTMIGQYKIIVTFNEQEVRHSPFLITVDSSELTSETLVKDEVDSPDDGATSSDVEQPVYENLIPINYERQDRAAMHTNNLKENGDDVSLREDNIYYAHQTNIASIQDHQLHRQISTRSISDPTLSKHQLFSPIKPPRTYCHDEHEDELNESPLVYSLTDYRLKQKRHNGLDLAVTNHPNSIMISSTTLNSTSSISTDDNTQENKRLTSKWLIIDEINRLTDLSKRETSTLTQTSHALKCCSNDPHAALSDKKIECERVIFMARQKLTSYNSEIKRLENLDPDRDYYSSDISHSTLIVQDLRLAVKEDYLRSLRKGKETKFYFFMCAIHYRSQTLFSHMVSSFDTLQSNGQVIFSNRMIIREVESNFVATIGVYCMEITMKHPITGLDHSPTICPHHHVSASARTVQCMQCDKQRLNSTVSIPGQHSKTNTMVRVTNFFQVDAVTIRKEDLKTQEFVLSISSASIPLKNKLYVKLQRLSELKIRKADYLTIYCDIGGSGVWIRRWFTLTNKQNLRYWASPDDEEANMPPTGEIDLHYCIDQMINVLQRETCARPHTFELRIAIPMKKSTDHGLFLGEQKQNEKYPSNSIIAQPFGKRTLFRYWLSADSKEERNNWCNILNQVLADLREWEVHS